MSCWARMIARVSGWLIFAAIFLCVGVLLASFAAWVIALSLLHPPRMTDGKAMYVLRRDSPADLGLPFETMSFEVIDPQRGEPEKLKLAAWWIPSEHARGRCVVLLHGYADAKVGSIAWAPLWRDLGFNVLAIDMRAHGESGGHHTTSGYFERHELAQALHQLKLQRPNDMRQIVLFGISLGSAVALATAKLEPELIDAVVLDCPFTSYPNAVRAHATRLGAPGKIVIPLAIRIAEWISGARFGDVEPLREMAESNRPILVIQSGRDSFVGQRDMQTIEELAARSDHIKLWRAPDAEHLLAIATDPDRYRSKLKGFLDVIRSDR